MDATFGWPAFGVYVHIPYYRRPLSAMLEPLLRAGFRLEHLVEPRPTAEFQIHDPQNYTKLLRHLVLFVFGPAKTLPNRRIPLHTRLIRGGQHKLR